MLCWAVLWKTNTVNHLQVVGNTSGIILCRVSLTTTTTISGDRLLALKLGLTYQQFVTIRRVRRAIILFWFGSIAVGSLSIFNAFTAMTITITSIVICVIISAFSYTKISIRLRQNQAQVQSHVQPEQGSAGGTPLNIERYRKTVSSIAWIQLALAVCYTPYLIVSVIIITGWNGTVVDVAWISVLTLVYLNSSLNPILYCWKITQVRQAMKAMVKRILCCGCWTLQTMKPLMTTRKEFSIKTPLWLTHF